MASFMTPILSDDEIREIIPVAALAWWDSKGPTARDLRDMWAARQVESAILEKVQAERDALRSERDAMAALLREARDAITLAGYGSRMAPEVRDTLECIDAAISKEQPK